MGTAPSQRKKPQDRQPKKKTGKPGKAVSTASAWKKSNALDHDLEVPSGNVARVRRTPMEALVSAGVIPNPLMRIVEESFSTEGKGDVNIKFEDLDAEQMTAVFELMDNVIVRCVIAPSVSPLPAEGEERDETRLYVDEVDMADKMFIFNFVVGGTADVEQFRQEQAAVLESLSSGEGVAL